MRHAARTLRRLCTEAEAKRTLPDIISAIPILPTHLQRDATHLRDVIIQASDATNAASEDSSDTFDREESRALLRKVMMLYSRLAKRAESPNDRIHDHIDNNVNAISVEQDNVESSPTIDNPATMEIDKLSENAETTSSTTPQEPSKKGDRSRYAVPTAEDAFAPNLLSSKNPVVRTFAPHVADLKYRVYAAHQQRVWIGWRNWF